MELRKKGVLKSLQDLKTFWDHMLSRENGTESSAVATAAVHRGQQGVCVCVCVCVLCVCVCVCVVCVHGCLHQGCSSTLLM